MAAIQYPSKTVRSEQTKALESTEEQKYLSLKSATGPPISILTLTLTITNASLFAMVWYCDPPGTESPLLSAFLCLHPGVW